MRIRVCALLLIIFAFGCASNDAKQNPASTKETIDLPVFTVGQWVQYRIVRLSNESGITKPANTSETDIKISLVGEKIIQATRFYWVEYLINKDKEHQRIVKVLIDTNGAIQPIRIVTKNGKFAPVEFDLKAWESRTGLNKEIILRELTGGFNIIPLLPLKPQQKPEIEELSVKLEEKDSLINCYKIILNDNPTGTIWYSEKVPFAGFVKAEIINTTYKNIISLTGYGGNGAKTLISEEPEGLDFQE